MHPVSVARAIVTCRSRYPAMRLRPLTQRTVDAALTELGFDAAEIESLRRDFHERQPELLRELAERAREVGLASYAERLLDRDQHAQENRRLVYSAIRLARPATVVETGTFNGTLSTFVLQALEDAGGGRLISLDLPAYKPIPHAVDVPLPRDSEPGWIVPDRLRERFELVVGDSRETLPGVLARVGTLDVFIHDSLHTTRHMLFEYRHAWPRLRPGGVLISDDIFMTPAYWWFTFRRRLPFLHLGNMGITRKPAAAA